jgi:hypothetical protein
VAELFSTDLIVIALAFAGLLATTVAILRDVRTFRLGLKGAGLEGLSSRA